MPTVLMTAPYMIPFLDRFKPVFAKYGLEPVSYTHLTLPTSDLV